MAVCGTVVNWKKGARDGAVRQVVNGCSDTETVVSLPVGAMEWNGGPRRGPRQRPWLTSGSVVQHCADRLGCNLQTSVQVACYLP
jgi:hypothetical protein